MPWPHCGDPAINDDLPCGTCGLTKAEWTLKVNVTRRFVISAGLACKVELKDAQGAFAHKARFRIELPDGRVEEGELNRSGYAKASTKLPGDALVSFPEHGAAVACLTEGARPGDAAGAFRCPVGPTKYEFKLVPAGVWVELQLVDDRGLAVANERYLARLADGSVREGRLDAAGFARLEGLPDGPVEVRYPDRTGPDWYDHDLHELELELRDGDGGLVADEPYQVRLPDGTLLEGRLDGQGRAKLAGLPTREVEVAFPARGRRAWELLGRLPRPVDPTYAPPADHLELELRDAEGRPRAGAAWEVRAADGRRFTGRLGPDGTSRLVGLVPGECEVRFPEEPAFAPPGSVVRGRLQLELVDDQGRAVAFAPYRLRTPDGQVRERRLDADGRATLEEVEDCEVLFPEHLADAWRATARQVVAPPPPSAHLELELRDARGAPRAFAPWRLRASDGRTFAGRLDAAGRARLDGLPPGDCDVDFPGEPEFAPPGLLRRGRLQLELRGTDGRPVPRAPFLLRTADGRTRAGRLDADGRATLEDIEDCEVQFPEHEAGVVTPEELARRKAAARAAEREAERERAREAERAAAKAERKRARAEREAERARAEAEAAEAERARAAAKAERKRARAEREAERARTAAEAERAAPKPRPGRLGDRWSPAPSTTPSPQQPRPQPGKLGERWSPAPSTTPSPQQPRPQPGKLGERWSPAPSTTPSPQQPKPQPGKLGERWSPAPSTTPSPQEPRPQPGKLGERWSPQQPPPTGGGGSA